MWILESRPDGEELESESESEEGLMVTRKVSRVEVRGTPASRRARREVVMRAGRRRRGVYYIHQRIVSITFHRKRYANADVLH